jgi:beta-phosphoglucomutase-like phosphatase (HAD superfamily)
LQLKALLFDVDGTLADTEDAHRTAFNLAFADFGFDWHWDRALYTRLLAVTGGRARIRYFLEDAGMETPDDETIAHMHKCKTAHYVEALEGGRVPLRPGVEALLREAMSEGLILAIATTTTPINVRTLLENTLGAEALDWFKVIGAGDCVDNLKPAPDVYLWVLYRLGLEAGECLAIEDSANGLKAARLAGLGTVVTHCPYTADQDFTGALAVFDGFDKAVDVAALRKLHKMSGMDNPPLTI